MRRPGAPAVALVNRVIVRSPVDIILRWLPRPHARTTHAAAFSCRRPRTGQGRPRDEDVALVHLDLACRRARPGGARRRGVLRQRRRRGANRTVGAVVRPRRGDCRYSGSAPSTSRLARCSSAAGCSAACARRSAAALATVAVSTLLAERLLLGPVAAAVAGRYVARSLAIWAGADDVSAGLISDSSTATAVAHARLRLVDPPTRPLVLDADDLAGDRGGGRGPAGRGVLGSHHRAGARRAASAAAGAFPDRPLPRSWLIVAFGRAVVRRRQCRRARRRSRPSSSRRGSGICGERRCSSACSPVAITALGAIVIGAMVPDPARRRMARRTAGWSGRARRSGRRLFASS